MAQRPKADVVVVGGGTVGGWSAVMAADSGARSVTLLEQDVVGAGASSRASGMVRAQGGTGTTVRLGMWTIDFYRRQAERLGVDSGFRPSGYLILAVTKSDVAAGLRRVAMQRVHGLPVEWLDTEAATSRVPTLGPGGHRGGTFTAIEGSIDPLRNVLAYTLAMKEAGVTLRERTPFLELRVEHRPGGGSRVVGVRTPDGLIATERVILAGGPFLRAIGGRIGVPIPVGCVRHQVAVTEPHEGLRDAGPMVFDVGAGIYWRGEDGGLLWGMSNPAERPGLAGAIDWPYLRRMERRLHRLAPITKSLGIRKVWAATIEFTSDHLPILGPAVGSAGDRIEGVTVASAAGHGMMWGPAVARVAVDLALTGTTDIIDVADLGLDRFDELGRSRLLADPIALPFPAGGDGVGHSAA